MPRHLITLLILIQILPRLAAVDFRDVQPILSENCYQCHGPDSAKRKADLRLDTKEGAYRTKNDVTSIVPGKSRESEVFKRMITTDADDLMPPAKSNKKLTPQQIELVKQWIDEGAGWGKHWAFEAPRRPVISDKLKVISGASELKTSHLSLQPWDALVLARLAKEKLTPSPEAPRETLIRRVTLDLTGLPPTPQEVDAFLNDKSPQAYERVVDRLLKSPRYGERWCWDWLDGARYADSNGYQGDPDRTMWPWRDWVIGAINSNMPFDQFTVWQIAGDLMPNATLEQKLATGFNRNHMINGEGGRIAEETRVENVMDRVETTGTMWLGLTVGCCRCHDHKFDPLTLRDYYGLYDFFNQTSEQGSGRGGQTPPVVDISTAADAEKVSAAQGKVDAVAKEVEAFELKKFPRPEGKSLAESDALKLPGNLPATLSKVEPAKRNVDGLLEATGYFKGKDDAYVKILDKLLAAVRAKNAAVTGVTKVMVMDTLPKLRDTFILSKGAYDKPTADKVTANVPASLPSLKVAVDGRRHENGSDSPKRGEPIKSLLPSAATPTRFDLAQWLVKKDNPLTARVTVNRFWQSFFGVGLVKTVEDFGVQGEKPVNQELLDWLAVEFMESGWDVKALHKRIVMSATYRQSSKVTPQLYERDPENRLLARGPRFRLPSWMMRDQALYVSGLMKESVGGPSVKPYQPAGIWEEATFGKISYKQDHGDALYRRSLYTFWRRIVGPTMFFDNAARQTCYVRALRTNTPLHALTTLNDTTYVEAARALAERIILASADNAARLDEAFRLVLMRRARADEKAILLQRLEKLKAQFGTDKEAVNKLLNVGEAKRDEKLDAAEHAAWTALCQLILNLDEAITKE